MQPTKGPKQVNGAALGFLIGEHSVILANSKLHPIKMQYQNKNKNGQTEHDAPQTKLL
jgi:hypothetical protein